LGHVAVSGTLRYRGDSLGAEFRDNFFVCEFNTHKLVRVALERQGSTFRATPHEFLICHDPDFHPTDVVEDADGSLLVIDTGGWFRSGCPTSQVAKPQIAGAIYRIRRVAADAIDDPRGLQVDWQKTPAADLATLLDDARPAVRERAIEALATRESTTGDEAIAALAGTQADPKSTAVRRTNVVWALTRIGTPAAQQTIREGLNDADATVRQAAASSAGTTGDVAATATLVQRLSSDEDQAVRREAATTLGKLHAPSAVPALLANLRAGGYDRALEHALIYALIEIGDRQQTLPALADAQPAVRRAALIALDQMDGGELSTDLVAPLLDSDDPALVRAALEVVGKHPTWADELTGDLRASLAGELSPEKSAAVRGVLLAFCREPAVEKLIAEHVADRQAPPAARALLLEVIARSGVSPWPATWIEALGTALGDTDERVLGPALVAAGMEGTGALADKLRALAADEARPSAVRVQAAESLAAGGQPLDEQLFELLATRLDESTPPVERLAAAEALARAELTAEQLTALVDRVAVAGPLELPALSRAFEGQSSKELGLQFFAALIDSPGLAALSPARLLEIAGGYPTEVQHAATQLAERQNAARAEQLAALEVRSRELSTGGDAARGRALFVSTRVGCAGCHRAAGEGGAVGPDLSKIGSIRTRRDLVESILLPSLTLARGYESFTVVTTGGLTHNGLLTRQTADAIWLRTPERAEVRVARDEVAELAPSPQSIMPEGLGRLLDDEDLRDLLAWLETLK
ncbi:MAG: HEAT repeat domain-containing protein, partial [Pirellulales bacterium]